MSEDAYIRFIVEHAGDDPGRLLLSAGRWPEIDVRRAARNIAARAKIRTKIPAWYTHPELEYPGSLPLEQASSEATALYKQAFVPDGARIADLTGGLGVDCWFMSRRAAKAHYCERNGELCAAARHNFAALEGTPDTFKASIGDTPEISSGSPQKDNSGDDCGDADAVTIKTLGGASISVHEGDGIEWLAQQAGHFDLIYLDPARRDAAARRVYDITDCEPNLLEIKDILFQKSSRVLAKISPMADISRTLTLFPEARELHVLAVAGEVKELLLLLESPGDNASGKNTQSTEHSATAVEPLIVAHDILHPCASHREGSQSVAAMLSTDRPSEGTQASRAATPAAGSTAPHHFGFLPSEEPVAEVRYATSIGKYLFQPSKAVLKAGAFRLLAERFHLEKLAPSTHLYTADTQPEGFPGKCFMVESVLDWSKASLRFLKQTHDRLEMTALNFPLSTDALRQKLSIPGGGTHHLFATTLSDSSKKLIICS